MSTKANLRNIVATWFAVWIVAIVMGVMSPIIPLRADASLGQELPAETPRLEYGATVFRERCTLCHGSHAMGEGVLPLSIEGYPATSLVKVNHAQTRAQIREAIVWGGVEGLRSDFSPPWGKELSWTELESVVLFVEGLRHDYDATKRLLDIEGEQVVASAEVGRDVYRTRCVLCHGVEGLGDGKMAKIIKEPPPFNLTVSRVPDEYLRMIIGGGGSEVGRSERMPPWRDELTAEQMGSVILYIKTLRR